MPRQKNFHAATSYKPNSFLPQIFNSPYTDSDYDTFEDFWANTVAGDCIDTIVDFTIGSGFKPKINAKDPRLTPEQKLNVEEKYKDLLFSLEEIDKKPSIDIKNKVDDQQRNASIFGRSILAFEQSGDMVMAVKPIHPRDLTRVFVRQDDWSLSSVYAFQKTDLLKTDEMIYFVNMSNSPIRRALHYGYSDMQRVIGHCRVLRRINEFDVPEMVESAWAGYGMVTVDNEGLAQEDRLSDLNMIRSHLNAGKFGIISGKKDEFGWFPFDLNPKISELSELINKYERGIIGHFKVPGALLGREEDQNMATLLGKIRIFINGVIEKKRSWINETLSRQWYHRNIKIIDPKALEDIEISVEFEAHIIESYVDVIDSIEKLKRIFPAIPDEELLRLAHLEQLVGKLKPEEIPEADQPLPSNMNSLKEIDNVINDGETKNKIQQLLKQQTGVRHGS